MGDRRLGKGRKHRRRERGRRLLLACNGAVTEPEYFKELATELGLAGLVVVDSRDRGKDPRTLVAGAAKRRNRDLAEARAERFDPFAEVWAVTDTDEFDVEKAQRLADEEGVRLALSNPCFEVWLVDHVGVCPPSCSSTRIAERAAFDRGVIAPAGSRRTSEARAKHLAIRDIAEKLPAALENAARHNTEEKRLARSNNPGNVGRYAVWTDVPDVVRSMLDGR